LWIGPIVLGLESGDRLFQLDILLAPSIVSFVADRQRSGVERGSLSARGEVRYLK
jgi:hypothetical protein